MFDCEQLQTPLLATTTALIERRSCGMVWVAWTEFGSVGVGRRTSVRQIDRKPHTPGHPGLDPVRRGSPSNKIKRMLMRGDREW